MNIFQRVLYVFLSIKEKGLQFLLGKHLKTSATNSTSKNVISPECSLTLNTETQKNIELVKQNMLDIVNNSKLTSDFLLDIAKKRGVKVLWIKNVQKVLSVLKEEEGLILERKGFCALLLNLLSLSGVSFKSKPMFLLEKNHRDFYFLLFHFYKLHSYFQDLPGLDCEAQMLFKEYSRNINLDMSQLNFEQMTALKEAIARDNEASQFVIELSQQLDGARKAMKKIHEGGANL